MIRHRQGVSAGMLALFASIGTLVCCALPILLVTLGLGSVVAALTLHAPVLAALSEYKTEMFALSAVVIGIAAWRVWQRTECPADPQLARLCRRANAWGKRMLFVAFALWLIGFFAAYLLLPMRQGLNL